MKLSPSQMQIVTERLSEKVLEAWKKQGILTLKVDEKQVIQRMVESLRIDLQKEQELEREVHRMLDNLEQSNPGEFQRSKMYPMLKQKLAKEKKVIL